MIAFFDRHVRVRLLTALAAVLALLNTSMLPAFAQQPEQAQPAFDRKEIEQLVAPIALYPDALLTHVLMGATYPFEIVQAARWREENSDIKGEELERAMQEQSWDESVKALAAFPQVLRMMNEKLDWTQRLGEAFLAQQEDVFAAVQDLRQRAEAAGNLKSSRELRVTQAPRDGGGPVYEIEPAGPDEVYVPVYDPTVVYGAWPYDDYPPYYWYPRNWRRDRVIWFGSAVLLGTALWAVWDWRRRGIRVDGHRFNTFNRTNIANPSWAFKPQHRKGVPFKTQALGAKFGPIAAPTRAQRAAMPSQLKKGTWQKPAPIATKPAPLSKGHLPAVKGTTAPTLKTQPITKALPKTHTPPVVKSPTAKPQVHVGKPAPHKPASPPVRAPKAAVTTHQKPPVVSKPVAPKAVQRSAPPKPVMAKPAPKAAAGAAKKKPDNK